MTARSRHLRRLRIAVTLVVALPILAGCQKSIGVSALNQCGQAVEARVESVPEISMSWLHLGPGERDEIVAIPDSAKRLYAQVRNGKDDTPVEFVAPVAALPKPPEGVDDDVEIVLTGDRCPAAAS
jgi:hypothetical protein